MSPEHAPRPSSRVGDLTRHLLVFANVFGSAIWIALLVDAYGKPCFWHLVPMPVVAATVNMYLAKRSGPTFDHQPTELLRAAFNIVLHITSAIWSHWNIPSLLWIPFLLGISTPFSEGRITWIAVGTLASFGVAGLLTGAGPKLAAFLGAGLFLHLMLLAHQRLVTALLLENRRAHHELEVAQRLAIAQEKLASIGQISAGVAHEINNPMCFITANLQDLLHELRAAPELPLGLMEYRDEVLPETVAGVARVNSIVDELRRFARGEPEQASPFDLRREIQSAARIARTQLGGGHRLIVEPMSEIPMRGLARQLGQVMLNLLINGLQALRDQGEVRVTAAVTSGTVRVLVADNGVGMNEATRLRLFEPFYTTKATDSTGLGLTLVRSIVLAHHGTIEVESQPGHGTCFVLTFPLAPADFTDRAEDEGRAHAPLSAPPRAAPAAPAHVPPSCALAPPRGEPSA